MKALIFSDLHYHLKNMETADRCLRMIEDIAIQNQIRTIFCLGDFWHEKSMLRSEVLRKVFNFFSSSKIDTWHILVGNHDLETTLDTAGNALDVLTMCSKVEVIDKPTSISDFHFIPFCRSADDFRAAVASIPKRGILLIHQGIEGAAYSSGVAHVSEIKAEDISEFPRVISGHIHAPQEFGNLVYIGSPMTHTFSEAGERKSVIIADDQTCCWERIYLDSLPRHISVDVEIDKLEDLQTSIEEKLSEANAKFIDHIRIRVTAEKGILNQIDKPDVLVKFENLVLQKVEKVGVKRDTIEETLSYDEMIIKYLDSVDTEIPKSDVIKMSREILAELANAQI